MIFVFYFISLLFIEHTIFASAVNFSFPLSEWNALQSLYESTRGEQWSYPQPISSSANRWDFSLPSENPCIASWQGIQCECDYRSQWCSVARLNLSSFDLRGEIPPSINNLANLTHLNLSRNAFMNGSIPETIVLLAYLEVLDMSSSALGGTVPAGLWSLPELYHLDLRANILHDKLPNSYSAALQTFMVGENSFFGSIPASALCGIPRISMIDVSKNRLTGSLPEELVNCEFLVHLNVRDNKLNGTIPELVQQMSALEYLDLSVNHFSGNVDVLDYNFTNLVHVGVEKNHLVGVFPIKLLESQRLEFVQLAANNFSGSIPALSSVCSPVLRFLDVSTNNFTGTFPESLLHLKESLVVLNASRNSFEGTLDLFYGLTGLLALHLDVNNFTGTLSESISRLDGLEIFDVAENSLFGSMPVSIFNLSKLELLSLAVNNFTGTVSNSISKLLNLQSLNLAVNKFCGTIPAALNNCPNITAISLRRNNFTGIVPPSFADLSSLTLLDVAENSLGGSFEEHPPWASFRSLFVMFLDHNEFSGQMDGFLAQFGNITSLNISNNAFTGPLPLSSDWTSLVYYAANNNKFSGSIPNVLVIISTPLYYFNVENNALRGQVPLVPFRCSLSYIIVSNNYLSGPISNLFSNKLVELLVASNALSGSLDADMIGMMPNLTTLRIGSNHLTGTLPSSLLKLSKLEVFLAANNSFTGNMHNLVDLENSSFLWSVYNIDVSNNMLTGEIPGQFFLSTKLQTFAASTNCLSGTLPEDICLAKSLTALILDGMKTAPACRHRVFPEWLGISSAFVLKKPTPTGTIPECLFRMPALQTLHLAGNLFSGTLPAGQISPSLVNLSVANNVLTGTLPTLLQDKNWENLIVSYNRFSGTLSSSATAVQNNGSFQAVVNRLSGDIPSILLMTLNIQVLSGNTFQCDITQSNLPKYDNKTATYSCGSDSVNRSLLAWFVVIAFFVVCFLVTVYRVVSGRVMTFSQYMQYFLFTFSDWTESPVLRSGFNRGGIAAIRSFFQTIKTIFIAFTIFCVVLVLPMVTWLSLRYSTHEYEYIWVVSAVYLTGKTPSGSLLLCFVIVLTTAWSWMAYKRRSVERAVDLQTKSTHFAYVIINFVVMLAADIGYVLVVTNENTLRQTFAALGLSIFKVLWNEAFVKESFVPLKEFFATFSARSPSSLEEKIAQGVPAFGSLHGIHLSDIEGISAPPATGHDVSSTLAFESTTNPILQRYSNSSDSTAVDQRASTLIVASSNDDDCSNRNSMISPSTSSFVAKEYGERTKSRADNRAKNRAIVNTVDMMSARDYAAITFNTVLNNVWIPSIAVILISPNCFFDVFSPPRTVAGNYDFTYCESLATLGLKSKCTQYATESVAVVYDAPFVYSYTCASTVVTYYASAFIYQMLIISVVFPLSKIFLKIMDSRIKKRYGVDAVSMQLPFVNRWDKLLTFLVINVLPTNLKSLTVSPPDRTIFLFDRFFIPRIYGMLALLLTYGVVFPPFAVVVCVAALVTILYEEAVILRLINKVRKGNQEDHRGSKNSKKKHNHVDEQQGQGKPKVTIVEAKSPLGDIISSEEKSQTLTEDSSIQTSSCISLTQTVNDGDSRDISTGPVAISTSPQTPFSSSSKPPVYGWYLSRLEEECQGLEDRFTNPVLVWIVLLSVVPAYAFLIFDTAADKFGWKWGTALSVSLLIAPILFYLLRCLVPSWFVDNVVGQLEGRHRSLNIEMREMILNGVGGVGDTGDVGVGDGMTGRNVSADSSASSHGRVWSANYNRGKRPVSAPLVHVLHWQPGVATERDSSVLRESTASSSTLDRLPPSMTTGDVARTSKGHPDNRPSWSSYLVQRGTVANEVDVQTRSAATRSNGNASNVFGRWRSWFR